MKHLRLVFNRCIHVIFLLILVFLLAAFNAKAADVTVAWDANSESDLDGYILYYGTASRNYASSIDVGNNTQHTLTGLVDGTTYYIAAKAYDTSKNQSDFSKELVYSQSAPNSAPNIPAKPTGPSSGYTQSSYSFDTSGTDPDGDLLTYRFDWGDGSTSDWGGAHARTHAYTAIGAYCIKAQSQDTHAATSGWSACLNVNIDIQNHTITASAGLNGSISPSGSVTVDNGMDQSFSINPNPNYRVADVVVDGVSVGAVTSFTFNNLTQGHTIAASFVYVTAEESTYSITASAGGHGSITPAGSVTVNQGSDQTFSIDPEQNYEVMDVVVDGVSVGAVTSYTFNKVTGDSTITASFKLYNRSPIAEAGPDQTVDEGVTVTLDASNSFDPDDGIATYLWEQTTGPSVTLFSASRLDEFDDGSTAGFWNWGAGSGGAHREQNDFHEIDSSSGRVWSSFDPAWLYQTVSADEDFDVYTKLEVPALNANYQKAGLAFRASDQNSHVQIIRLNGQQVEGGHTINGSAGSVVNDVTATTLWVRIRREGSSFDTYYASSSPESEYDWTLLEPSNALSYSGNGQVGIFASDSGGGQFTAKFDYFRNWLENPITTNTGAQPSFIAPAVGPSGASLTFQLTVTDNGGLQSTGTCIVNVNSTNNENSAPVSNAGDDQMVEEGELVTLSGVSSSDPDDNIAKYSWKQIGGKSVTLSSSKLAEATFVAPNVTADSETLMFQLTLLDADGLEDVDTCQIEVTRSAEVDSDSDGVPDNRDAFPQDPDESVDTDGDGYGNNADEDDDNDGMPDAWELSYGLDPLKDDAAADPDGDDFSNINEYNLGSKPNHHEGNYLPGAPALLAPENSATVSLTPQLDTGEFNDPNINDVHSKTRWKILRAFDDVCVFDVTTPASLTSIIIPKQILEEDTEYIWQARFIDGQDASSEWSEERNFITELAVHDADKNGVPDVQEVIEGVDLDEDGTMDIAQSDIKCVSLEEGTGQVCIGIRDAENVVSIDSLEAEDPNDPELMSNANGKPNYFEFGMLDFKLLVNNPGDETTVTIYLSKPAFKHANCFKYDPVNEVWLDYSDYTSFSSNRKQVYLTLKDGGFGDADGIENGIIVDPLAFGSETDPSSGSSDSPVEDIVDGILPFGCFIAAAAGDPASSQPMSVWYLTKMLEFWLIFLLPLLLYLFKTLVRLTRDHRNKNLSDPGDSQARFLAV